MGTLFGIRAICELVVAIWYLQQDDLLAQQRLPSDIISARVFTIKGGTQRLTSNIISARVFTQ